MIYSARDNFSLSLAPSHSLSLSISLILSHSSFRLVEGYDNELESGHFILYHSLNNLIKVSVKCIVN